LLFNELNIIGPIQQALIAQGYTEPTPIQMKAIPPLLEGLDLLGCAQTGTGKTAAFAVPILQSLSLGQGVQKGKRQIKALILAPTRELAIQIGDCFVAYGANLTQRTLVIFGGVGQAPQTKELDKGIDILVSNLAGTILKNPVKIEITPAFAPIDIIDQEIYFVDKDNKTNLLVYLLKDLDYDSVLVFSKTKHGADKIVKELEKKGFDSVAIHGNKSQTNRQQALSDFKERKVRILIATDIAARGLDIEELSHVINYNLPDVPETYIHRIGRTGRAGLGGKAISFCDFEEKSLLHDIQKLTGKTLPEIKDHPYPLINNYIAPKETRVSHSPSSRSRYSASGSSARSTSPDGRKTDKSPYTHKTGTGRGAYNSKPASRSK